VEPHSEINKLQDVEILKIPSRRQFSYATLLYDQITGLITVGNSHYYMGVDRQIIS